MTIQSTRSLRRRAALSAIVTTKPAGFGILQGRVTMPRSTRTLTIKMASRAVGNLLKGGLFAVPVAITFNDLVGSPAEVHGMSMQPSINPDLSAPEDDEGVDVVWQDKLSIARNKYEKGSIVVFRNPFDPKERMVKRLIAVGGDYVRPLGSRHEILRVPQGSCWVEGDNPRFSGDSNQFGPIPLALIEAKITHVLWPPRRIGPLDQNLPEMHRRSNPGR